jgi:hypothetical protein
VPGKKPESVWKKESRKKKKSGEKRKRIMLELLQMEDN